MDHDFCNADGARRLKQRIEEYWRERGYTVEIKLVEAGFVAARRSARTDVRSDMVNGFPTRSAGDDRSRPPIAPGGPATDNGNDNVNVFNGTTWEDGINPGGQVPYTTNDGLVNDTAYVSGTPAFNLVPEEALANFIGDDPRGTWTLTYARSVTTSPVR